MSGTCQHLDGLVVREHFRRKARGHVEIDGAEVICGKCGDLWPYREREQLPDWLRAALEQQGL